MGQYSTEELLKAQRASIPAEKRPAEWDGLDNGDEGKHTEDTSKTAKAS